MIPPVSSRIFQPFVMYRLSLCRMWVEKAWDECVLRDANVLKTALFIDTPRWPSGRRWVLSAPWAATLGALRMCQVLFRGGSSTSRHSGQRLAVMLPMRLRGARALAWGPWGGGGRPGFRPRQVGCRHAAGCSPTSPLLPRGRGTAAHRCLAQCPPHWPHPLTSTEKPPWRSC